MKSQAGGKIIRTFQSSPSGKKASLQIRATKEVEESWFFSRDTARARHHK